MRTYMARLGNFTFGIDTAAFQELQRTSTYKWQAKERIGRRPAQQNTGRGADTITLNGVIYPHYRGGLGQIEALRAQAVTGEPLPLIYAFEAVGQYCGLWCVTSIEEARTVFFDNGTPRRIEFQLSLVEYGEDFA
jgi:phage protein U